MLNILNGAVHYYYVQTFYGLCRAIILTMTIVAKMANKHYSKNMIFISAIESGKIVIHKVFRYYRHLVQWLISLFFPFLIMLTLHNASFFSENVL